MPSFLHTCYRIGEIDRSVAFCEQLGFAEVAPTAPAAAARATASPSSATPTVIESS